MADPTISPPDASAKPKWLLRRLYPSTWIVLLLATAVLLLVEIPGGRVGRTSYTHGWPLVFLERDYSADSVLAQEIATATQSPRWVKGKFDGYNDLSRNKLPWRIEAMLSPWSTENVKARSYWHAAADTAISLALVIAVAWAFHQAQEKRSPFQFRLRTMLAAVVVFGWIFSRAADWHRAVLNEPEIVVQLIGDNSEPNPHRDRLDASGLASGEPS